MQSCVAQRFRTMDLQCSATLQVSIAALVHLEGMLSPHLPEVSDSRPAPLFCTGAAGDERVRSSLSIGSASSSSQYSVLAAIARPVYALSTLFASKDCPAIPQHDYDANIHRDDRLPPAGTSLLTVGLPGRG